LLREERAIVTEIPGTTRDTLEERAFVGGIPLNIVDTAGIHETSDVVEQIGVDKAKKVIENADLILYVVDQSKTYDEEEQQIVDLIQNKKVIVLLNKSDLDAKTNVEDIQNHIDADVISVSMQNKDGMDIFYKLIQEMFFEGELQLDNNIMSINERQKINLERAKESLLRVKESIANDMPEDFFTIDLLDAYESLGLIIGESVNDDLVNQIFAEFCTGK
jgi:tRNA modification GTPase